MKSRKSFGFCFPPYPTVEIAPSRQRLAVHAVAVEGASKMLILPRRERLFVLWRRAIAAGRVEVYGRDHRGRVLFHVRATAFLDAGPGGTPRLWLKRAKPIRKARA